MNATRERATPQLAVPRASSLLPLLAALFALLVFTAGCTMAPSYERPGQPVTADYPDYPEYQGVGASGSGHGSAQDVRDGKLASSPSEGAGKAEGSEGSDDSEGSTLSGVGETALTPEERRERAWSGEEQKDSTAAPSDSYASAWSEHKEAGINDATDEFPANGNPAWQDFFVDSNMRSLIGLALQNNREMRVAVLNIEKARAMYQIERADLLPSIAASGANSNQRLGPAFTGQPYSIKRQSSVTVGLTSYELDLFGRVRSLKDAALEKYFATAQTAHSAQVSLVAEVASTYLQLVAYKELYAITEETYQSRLKSYDLTKVMFESGVASQLVLNQAKGLMEEARVSAVQYKTQVLMAENALALLVGCPLPSDIKIPEKLAEVKALRDVPAGLPSQLLERRPDILAAEHNLKSANGNIGAARANFFPRIGLTANLGTLSLEMDHLFENASRTWSFAPSVTLPIFEGGRNVATLESSEVDKKIAVANYEKAIQSAFRDVADALAQRSTITEHLEAARSLMEASRQTYDLSSIRYEAGVDSYLNVMDSQRMYFNSRQAYVNSLLLREVNTLTVYKALGGGWR